MEEAGHRQDIPFLCFNVNSTAYRVTQLKPLKGGENPSGSTTVHYGRMLSLLLKTMKLALATANGGCKSTKDTEVCILHIN